MPNSLSSKSGVHGKGMEQSSVQNGWNGCIEQFKDRKTRGLVLINADKLLDETLKCLEPLATLWPDSLCLPKKVLKQDEVWSA